MHFPQDSVFHFFSHLQVFAISPAAACRSTRRQRSTRWSVPTALRCRWYKAADRRSTVPASARRTGRTLPAGRQYIHVAFFLGLVHLPHPPAFLKKIAWVPLSASFRPRPPPSPPSPTHYLHIFRVYRLLISQTASRVPPLQTGLSISIGTTGNATCFHSTVSASVPRGNLTSTSPCTRKKVKAPLGIPVGSTR